MLYYLFEYLDTHFDLPGPGFFNTSHFGRLWPCSHLWLFLSFSEIPSLACCVSKQVGETVRDLGLKGQIRKTGHSYHGRVDHSGSHFDTSFALRQT